MLYIWIPTMAQEEVALRLVNLSEVGSGARGSVMASADLTLLITVRMSSLGVIGAVSMTCSHVMKRPEALQVKSV